MRKTGIAWCVFGLLVGSWIYGLIALPIANAVLLFFAPVLIKALLFSNNEPKGMWFYDTAGRDRNN